MQKLCNNLQNHLILQGSAKLIKIQNFYKSLNIYLHIYFKKQLIQLYATQLYKQLYTIVHNFTKPNTIWQNFTNKNYAHLQKCKFYKNLYNTSHNYTQCTTLFATRQHVTKLYKTPQLYTTVQTSTNIYKPIQNSTTSLQHTFKQIYNTIHNSTTLTAQILHHFPQLYNIIHQSAITRQHSSNFTKPYINWQNFTKPNKHVHNSSKLYKLT